VNGVYQLSDPANLRDQEQVYLTVRKKEERIYPDEIVKALPQIDPHHPLASEWKIREKSCQKLMKYLHSRGKSLDMMDLGCGNGWMANRLTTVPGSTVYAVDVNGLELTQGARVFPPTDRLRFVYGDILKDIFPPKTFDIIILASAIQYFPDLKILIKKLFSLLGDTGEIHILDSPVYDRTSISDAKNRTRNYYQSLAIPEMMKFYHHHAWEDLGEFNFRIQEPSNAFIRFFEKRFHLNMVSLFPWILIRK
jgi:ubiquinone/menaquinone biosynthesis C-methylase UbiE